MHRSVITQEKENKDNIELTQGRTGYCTKRPTRCQLRDKEAVPVHRHVFIEFTAEAYREDEQEVALLRRGTSAILDRGNEHKWKKPWEIFQQ